MGGGTDYIGRNIRKYLNDYNKKDSIWWNPFITFDLSREETNNYYEAFVRCNPHMIEKLTELENKVIGCWCIDNSHGEILIKLYREFVENEKNTPSQGEFAENEKKPSLQRDNFEREKNSIHIRRWRLIFGEKDGTKESESIFHL